MKFEFGKFKSTYKVNQPRAIKMINNFCKKNIEKVSLLDKKFKHINIQNISENIELIECEKKRIVKIQKDLSYDLKILHAIKDIAKANIFQRETNYLITKIEKLKNSMDQYLLLEKIYKNSTKA